MANRCVLATTPHWGSTHIACALAKVEGGMRNKGQKKSSEYTYSSPEAAKPHCKYIHRIISSIHDLEKRRKLGYT